MDGLRAKSILSVVLRIHLVKGKKRQTDNVIS